MLEDFTDTLVRFGGAFEVLVGLDDFSDVFTLNARNISKLKYYEWEKIG